MKSSTALCLLAATCLALPATVFAQWQWRDASGRLVYSDVPPPPSVPAGSIMQAPGRVAGNFHPVEAPIQKADGTQPAAKAIAASASAAKPAPAPSAEEAFQKRRAAQQKAEAEQATKEREAQQRLARCTELRNYATGLQQGMRAAVAGPDGSLQHLDGERRQAEIAKTNASLQQDCGA